MGVFQTLVLVQVVGAAAVYAYYKKIDGDEDYRQRLHLIKSPSLECRTIFFILPVCYYTIFYLNQFRN